MITAAGTTTYSYDEADWLMDVNGTPYTYDANGNLLAEGEAVYYDYDEKQKHVFNSISRLGRIDAVNNSLICTNAGL